MRPANYILFRYFLHDEFDDRIAAPNQPAIFESVKGKGAGYRGSSDDEIERNNYLMRFRVEQFLDELALVFDVGYRVTRRVENRWNEGTDDYDLVPTEADDTVFTRFVALPRLGVVAVKDGTGDRLSAISGMGRLKSIISAHSPIMLHYEKTAQAADIDRAMQFFRLTEFSFDVRPFNPHPSSPGERLDELMREAGVGRFKGRAKPATTSKMKADDGGLIAEAVGLSRAGYGQYSLKAETDSGATLSYGRPQFNQDRDRNAAAADRPRVLRVAVPQDDPDMTPEEHVVSVMLELFDGRKRQA
jgi:hypothetical protein